ncbi:MAG: DMT family transporter [Lachnospiraceae bacterium]|nr:DMT family transporter [Lachnospiraceae bacterium]
MKRFATLWIILAGILWGCMGLFVRRLNALGLVSMQVVELRALVTSVVMFLVLFIGKRELLRIRLRDLWCFLGTGLCSIVFFNFCYFKAIELTSLSVAAVLMYTAPVLVMIFSFFLFHEKFTGRKVLALVMTFAGCVLVTGVLDQQNMVSPMGILTGLGAGLGYALYSIFGRYALERGYQSFTITFYTFFIAFIGTLFLTDIRPVMQVACQDVASILISLGLGVICTVFPFLLYTLGLSYVENSKASIFASVEPVTATLLGAVVYQEKLSVSGTLGVVLVIVALIICGKTGEKS